jgi:peroxiredoxin
MNEGLALTAASLLATLGNLATHYPKIKSNHAPLRPRREQALMVVALLLAGSGFFLQPGIVGYMLGGVAAILAVMFLVATATSDLPKKKLSVGVGAVAPDFTATDASGREFRLSDLRNRPVLLKFYRGFWCPYCIAELEQFNRYARDFEKLGVSLIAVSSDRVDELEPFARKHKWRIQLLADPTLAIHRLYNVQSRKFTPKRGPFRDLAIPTTILLDKEGRVLWLEQTSNFRVRPQARAPAARSPRLQQDQHRNCCSRTCRLNLPFAGSPISFISASPRSTC